MLIHIIIGDIAKASRAELTGSVFIVCINCFHCCTIASALDPRLAICVQEALVTNINSMS